MLGTGLDDQLFQAPRETSIGIQVLVNMKGIKPDTIQKFSALADEDKVLLNDAIKHESQLRRWVTRFHCEIVDPMHKDAITTVGLFDLAVKYFELRPFSYAIL